MTTAAPDLEIRSFRAAGADRRDVYAEVDGNLDVRLRRGEVKDAGSGAHSMVIQFVLDGMDTDLVIASDTRALLDSLLAARHTIDLALAGMGVDR